MIPFNQTEINKIFDITKIITLFTERLSPLRACKEELFDFWQMKYMYEGERTTVVAEVPHLMTAGQVMFHPPGIPHHSVEKLNKHCKIGMISFICHSSIMPFFSHKVFTLKPKEEKLILDIFERGKSIFKWFDYECSQRGMYVVDDISPAQLYRLKLDIELFLTILYTEYNDAADINILETAKKRNQNKELFISIVEYLEKNIHCNLTIEQIAASCDISISSIKKIFKEETGNGVIHYFNRLKIKKAMKLIQESSLSFSQISEELGFSSSFYFSRMFKKIMGESPTEYSKSIDKEAEKKRNPNENEFLL